VPQIMRALGHKTERMALYNCRLANKKQLGDQVREILDRADAAHDAKRVHKRRAGLRVVG
jgi:hypothetical protein